MASDVQAAAAFCEQMRAAVNTAVASLKEGLCLLLCLRKSFPRVIRTVGLTCKAYVYRFKPLHPPPTVVDLDREDVGDVVRAVLCASDCRPDLCSLCRYEPWVSNLDVLRRHGEFSPDWRAERPVDEHWSLHMMYSWE